jgi:hypothetical protein
LLLLPGRGGQRGLVPRRHDEARWFCAANMSGTGAMLAAMDALTGTRATPPPVPLTECGQACLADEVLRRLANRRDRPDRPRSRACAT